MSGEGIAQGDEAIDFRWWHADELDDNIMGFGQASLIDSIRARADLPESQHTGETHPAR